MTGLCTVIALSILFVKPTWWLVPFVVGSAALLVLMWLGAKADAEAVLPAFLLGFALAPVMARHRALQTRFRVVSFGLLTPFFFLHAGMNVSLPLVIANAGLLVLLLGAKLVCKSAAVYPLARRYASTHAWPVSLLMSTGLTFGTIASQAGLSLGVISRAQFSVLVCVVALSAVVPTVIAQRLIARNPVQHPSEVPSADHAAAASPDSR